MTQGNGSDETGQLHNIADINSAICQTFGQVYDIEQEIDRLKEQHLEALQKKRSKLWRELKADTDINLKTLKAHYKPYAIARDAKENFEDEDEAGKVLDGIKIAHQALYAGETVDFIEVIERTLPAQGNLAG